MHAQTPSKIRVQGLEKSFGTHSVLNNISFDVRKGESFVVIGGSGSGKSVTLKCILGLIQPTRGSIQIDGQEVTRLSSKQREAFMTKIGMLFQGSALFDSLPVWENVCFGLLIKKKIQKNEAKELAIETLAKVGLEADTAFKFPSELSGGMMRRVGLARAIVSKPEILFFDEPTSGLDPITSALINELILQCVCDLGATAITITHDMKSVRTIADTVAMIYNGKVQWLGSKEEMDRCNDPYVHQFIDGNSAGPIQAKLI